MPPAPPSFELTAPVVLLFVPAVVLVTLTEKVQEALAANVAPVRLTELDPPVAVILPPPQEPASPLGVATARPAGRGSVKAIPLSDAPALGLVMVKLRLVLPYTRMPAAPNDLPMVGGPNTARLAVAVPPVPPSVELIASVALFFVPAAVPVTLTEKVQEALAANVSPVRLTEPDPPVAVMLPPTQVLVSPGDADTARPASKGSLKAIPLSDAPVFGLAMVKLSVVFPPTAILAAPNDLPMVGGFNGATVTLAEAVPPVPPSVELTASVVLFFVPDAVPVTFTEKVQESPYRKSAPEKFTVLATVSAVMVAPKVSVLQVLLTKLDDDMTRPVGKLSVKLTRNAPPWSAPVRVKLSVVVPPNGMLAGLNALLKVTE